jgi:ribonucleoside-diphosphate reductase alpha chain
MLEAPLAYFTAVNPAAVSPSVWSANKTDSVITFCMEVSEEAKTKKDFGAIDLLEKVKLTQQNWVEAGTHKECCVKPWLRHSVSNTISVQPHEWEKVEEYIYHNRQYFAGISLLPSTGDLDYCQAPFCAVSTPAEILHKYGEGSLFASGLIVDGVHAYNDLWKACDAILGRFKPQGFLQEDWIRRAKQFTERYCDINIQKMIYMLKEVNNWKHWCDLHRVWKDVNYAEMREESDNTNLIAEVACAGGQCSLF